MMAKVSELSMHQANALRLQQEVKEKEAALEQCYINMEKGLPPDAEIEREWQRQVQVDEQRTVDRDAAQAVRFIRNFIFIVSIDKYDAGLLAVFLPVELRCLFRKNVLE